MLLILLACTDGGGDPVASVPRYRYSHVGTFDAAGENLYITGGSGSGGKRRDAWRFSDQAWERMGDPPRDIFRSTLVQEPGTDIAWVFGGSEGNSSTESASLERWDLSTDTWTTLGEGGPPGRYKADAVWDGSRMLVYGGRFDDGDETLTRSDLWAFDPDTETWEELEQVGGPGALTRSGMALADDGRVWLMGGIDADDTRHDWLWTLDTRSESGKAIWQEVFVVGETPGVRASHTVHWYADHLWIWAGQGEDTVLWAFDPSTATWAAYDSEPAPIGRDAQVSASPDGRHLTIMGGDPADDENAPNFVNDVWELDLDTQEWTELAGWGE